MIEPTPSDIGRTVVYRDQAIGQVEEGVIISYNANYVLVRYTGDPIAKATRRQDLEWAPAAAQP